MFIVIEGLDKTGKTSLAKYLSERLGCPITKFSAPTGDPYLEYMRYLVKDAHPAVLDRFYLGELAYGPVKRGKSELTKQERTNIEMMTMALKPFLIYSSTDTKTIKENFVKDGEDFTTEKDVEPLKQHYNQAIKSGILTWYQFDYQKDKDYSKIFQPIKKWVKNVLLQEERLRRIQHIRLIGNPDAKVLLVGDVCNYKAKHTKDQALAIPFASGPAAEYLYNALEEAKIPLTDIAITNFDKYHINKLDLVDESIVMPNLQRVVFLGPMKGAMKDKRKSEIIFEDVVSIKHPSWAKRFNYPLKTYAKELRTAVYGK